MVFTTHHGVKHRHSHISWAITCTHLCTCLKVFRQGFFSLVQNSVRQAMLHSPKIFSTVSGLMEILCENFIVKKNLLCFFLACIFKKAIKKVLTILHSIEFLSTKVSSLLICINTLIKKVYLFSSSHTNTYCELNSEVKAFVKQLTKCKFNVNSMTIAIIA